MQSLSLKHLVWFEKREARKDVVASLWGEETQDEEDEGDEEDQEGVDKSADLKKVKVMFMEDPHLCRILARMSMSLTLPFNAFEKVFCPNSFLKAWPDPGKADWL